MIAYLVIIEDRHTDVDVEVWLDANLALERGEAIARDSARRPQDYEEQDIPQWMYFATYSVEGDSVRVQAVETKS